MIRTVLQKLNGQDIMVYNRKIQKRIPVIDSHLNTPCISANENLMPKPESQKSI